MNKKEESDNGPGRTSCADYHHMTGPELKKKVAETMTWSCLLDQEPCMKGAERSATSTSICDAMALDKTMEISRIIGQDMTMMFGLENASNIATHIAVDKKMRLLYRGDFSQTLSDIQEDVASVAEMYLEPTELDRQHYIKLIETHKNRCDRCDGGCEFCTYAKYNVIDRGE